MKYTSTYIYIYIYIYIRYADMISDKTLMLPESLGFVCITYGQLDFFAELGMSTWERTCWMRCFGHAKPNQLRMTARSCVNIMVD